MENITGSGLVITLTASNTFPQGLTLTQFADDADALDIPSIKVGDSAIGLNGDLVVWNKAAVKPLTINIIPGGQDAINLGILLAANTPGRGRFPARDEIYLTAIYPSGATVTAIGGAITDGQPGDGVASAGRLKTRAFTFAFEDIIEN